MIKKLIRYLTQALLPYTCILCDEKTNRTFDLCCDCEQELPSIQNACQCCGIPLNLPDNLCGHCLKDPPHFDQTLALFFYQSPIPKLITDLKFHQHLAHATIFGTLMAKRLAAVEKPDCIIPMPLHKKRLRERGFNQSVEIAKPIAKSLHIPLNCFSCQRLRHTEPQSSLPAKKRRSNIKNAFAVNPKFNAQHVAIVDDVMTSGHTANELAHVLKKQGVKRVDVWTVARTGK